MSTWFGYLQITSPCTEIRTRLVDWCNISARMEADSGNMRPNFTGENTHSDDLYDKNRSTKEHGLSHHKTWEWPGVNGWCLAVFTRPIPHGNCHLSLQQVIICNNLIKTSELAGITTPVYSTPAILYETITGYIRVSLTEQPSGVVYRFVYKVCLTQRFRGWVIKWLPAYSHAP